jgi:hypothetical protein
MGEKSCSLLLFCRQVKTLLSQKEHALKSRATKKVYLCYIF